MARDCPNADGGGGKGGETWGLPDRCVEGAQKGELFRSESSGGSTAGHTFVSKGLQAGSCTVFRKRLGHP